MREALAMSIYRRMGLPAPRESFAKFYINNEYQGVYAMVEPIDTLFTKRTLNDSTGYLYEYRYVMPFFTEYLGDDVAAYKPLFSANDPGDKPLEGAAIVARHGKGAFVYTGIAFFRQLPEGVPGAYRLMANLLALGAAK